MNPPPAPIPGIVRDPRFQDHVGPAGHPERPERLLAVERALEPLFDRLLDVAPRAASDDEILRAHDREHLERLEALRGRAARLDPDTYACEHSVEVARLAAGSTIELALRVARGDSPSGFALVRPPGHHAERNGAMGFCLLNQIAMAARALREEAGVERVAVVDFDVHHGNGTQHILEEERDALFLSTHQFPFYPGTGALAERGRGAGAGSTVNLPLPAGCGDAEYGAVFAEVVVPVLLEFRPQILLVSAGFDAHARDPLASMQLTTEGFAGIARQLRAVADEICGGRLVLALEGGYDLDALSAAVRAVIEVLAGAAGPPVGSASTSEPFAEELVRLFREAHSGNFASLCAPVRA
jgi:acetoin utilization deacetylase AcuC-like enzyme